MTGQEGSRAGQKRRTRADLLRAARALIETGRQPTVADVADSAGISRATAYRYFSKPEDITREALLDSIANEAVAIGDIADPAARVDQVVHQVTDLISRNEEGFRAFLASAVGGASREPRGGRRLGWLAEAVEPVRPQLTDAAHRRLISALALVTGVETLVVFRDVCGLDEAESEAVARWTAQVVLKAALAEVSGEGAGGPSVPP